MCLLSAAKRTWVSATCDEGARIIEQQPSALTDHVKVIRRSSMGDVAEYLRK
jgi:hypothetical protein